MAKIMIVDDDIEIAENLAVILSNAGYQVDMLDSTDGAEEKIGASAPDLLVLDVMFPDNPVAGFDLARKIRRKSTTRNIPVLMLTSINQEFPMDFSGNDIDDDWLPVQEFMEKPVDAVKLLGAVKRLLPSK